VAQRRRREFKNLYARCGRHSFQLFNKQNLFVNVFRIIRSMNGIRRSSSGDEADGPSAPRRSVLAGTASVAGSVSGCQRGGDAEVASSPERMATSPVGQTAGATDSPSASSGSSPTSTAVAGRRRGICRVFQRFDKSGELNGVQVHDRVTASSDGTYLSIHSVDGSWTLGSE